MKFENILKSELSEAVEIIDRIKVLINTCGITLSSILKEGKHLEDKFYSTAIHFTRINFEAIESIFSLLKAGHLSESIVLLRWHLELGHLFYYLSENRTEYEEWLSGKEIKPHIIGKFFENNGLASWRNTYAEWSNITHGNSDYVEGCFAFSKMCPVDDKQILIISRLLRDFMFTLHKFTYVLGALLKPGLNTDEYNTITKEYNQLQELIIKFSDEHNIKENNLMNE